MDDPKTEPKAAPVEPAKKNRNGIIVVVLVLVAVCAFLLLRPNPDGDKKVKACAEVTLTSCDLERYNSSVFGTVKNTCDTKLNAIKIVAGAYTADGTLLYEDEEYVQDLAPGQQKTFEALLGDPAYQGTNCKARVDSGY